MDDLTPQQQALNLVDDLRQRVLTNKAIDRGEYKKLIEHLRAGRVSAQQTAESGTGKRTKKAPVAKLSLKDLL
jgi:hypothetical protein